MSDNQTVLVIDTAMAGCGVCVYDVACDAAFDAYSDDPRGQAQVLVPMVQDVLKNAALGFDDLTDIVVCNGPGTFTGIRIGLSAAKTFGIVVNVPVYGVGSMQALAMSATNAGLSKEMLVVVETRRQDFYVQRFDGAGLALDEPQSLMVEDVDVGSAVLIGDAAQRFDPQPAILRAGVSPRFLLRHSRLRQAAGNWRAKPRPKPLGVGQSSLGSAMIQGGIFC